MHESGALNGEFNTKQAIELAPPFDGNYQRWYIPLYCKKVMEEGRPDGLKGNIHIFPDAELTENRYSVNSFFSKIKDGIKYAATAYSRTPSPEGSFLDGEKPIVNSLIMAAHAHRAITSDPTQLQPDNDIHDSHTTSYRLLPQEVAGMGTVAAQLSYSTGQAHDGVLPFLLRVEPSDHTIPITEIEIIEKEKKLIGFEWKGYAIRTTFKERAAQRKDEEALSAFEEEHVSSLGGLTRVESLEEIMQLFSQAASGEIPCRQYLPTPLSAKPKPPSPHAEPLVVVNAEAAVATESLTIDQFIEAYLQEFWEKIGRTTESQQRDFISKDMLAKRQSIWQTEPLYSAISSMNKERLGLKDDPKVILAKLAQYYRLGKLIAANEGTLETRTVIHETMKFIKDPEYKNELSQNKKLRHVASHPVPESLIKDFCGMCGMDTNNSIELETILTQLVRPLDVVAPFWEFYLNEKMTGEDIHDSGIVTEGGVSGYIKWLVKNKEKMVDAIDSVHPQKTFEYSAWGSLGFNTAEKVRKANNDQVGRPPHRVTDRWSGAHTVDEERNIARRTRDANQQ